MTVAGNNGYGWIGPGAAAGRLVLGVDVLANAQGLVRMDVQVALTGRGSTNMLTSRITTRDFYGVFKVKVCLQNSNCLQYLMTLPFSSRLALQAITLLSYFNLLFPVSVIPL